MDKIKCIDCIFSSIDSGFCICRRSYKVRDADRLHYCRNFYEKNGGERSKGTIEILGFMNQIIKESESKR